ncbi:5-oxoprolinase/urea amidolyase family protein [Sinomonas sp. ASV322]|uniref:5-oxoprolinase subunit B/C family protein n=1 Tax=Sinomonas sp. ASV322 TaxID=3041920 RepID=UPI0027DE845A|nr:5-oxoprolinase/urea amidolyase family protein [Sinomonas sp. ASV322]MDQ4502562.1 5-oxoprolinase/urea amidolyase family protein [Sinomonas sp. ASV322]
MRTAPNRDATAEGREAVVGIRPSGERAILIELASPGAVLSLARELDAAPPPGVVDVVAAATTVLVAADSPASLPGIVRRVRELGGASAAPRAGKLVVIETVYDGADLDEVARLAGLSREGVVAAHAGQVWSAAFIGFAPGFAYLTGDGALDVPRRTSPRTAVPAGSVGLAGTYSAVYPSQSPGGWQLIGRTSAPMWDLGRDDPALIHPGDEVRFEPVRARAELTQPGPAARTHAEGAAPSSSDVSTAGLVIEPGLRAGGLVVVAPGLQTTVQDLGRPGLAALGVSAAGAMDRDSLRSANRAVGNSPDAAGLEVLFGGLALRAAGDQVLAVTGARAVLSVTTDDGAAPSRSERHPALGEPFALLGGETLRLGTPSAGLRSYVAVRGGLDVPPVLGSRSTDTLAGIGPEPLTAGDLLEVLRPRGAHVVGLPETPPPLPEGVTALRVVPGPRQDWFTEDAARGFFDAEWTVTPQSNRVGLRLAGSALAWNRSDELKSEGTVRGSIQVPPNGQPVLFLADHPVTGGYPVIGVVVEADLDLAGQLPPGARVRFAAVAPIHAPLRPTHALPPHPPLGTPRA